MSFVLSHPFRARIYDAIGYALLSIGAVVMLLPLLLMLFAAFKPAAEIASWPPTLLPQTWTLENFRGLFSAVPMGIFFFNSVITSFVSTFMVLLTSAIAGAIFAKYEFPGRRFLFALIIATAIVPFESYMIPLYSYLVKMGWINTYQGLIAPYILMSFGIFLLRQHVASTVPNELLEAARVDGASEWWILIRVILPLTGPALSALGIFAFIQAWSAFIWPLLVANSQQLFNMEVGLSAFQFRFSTDYGKLMAGSVISILPMVTIFMILRARILDSIAMSGMK